MLTLHAPVTETVPDAVLNVRAELNRIDAAINADTLHCNAAGIWKALLAPENNSLRGDALVLTAALASLERRPGQGVRVSKAQLAARCASLKALLILADKVGWVTIHETLSGME
jgi:hypothetical protein